MIDRVVREAVAGVLLAGGQSRRMGGGDKCLRTLGGRPILSHIIERARPQVAALVLNANGDPARFAEFGLPVAADVVEDFAGPLAGVLTGLDWAAEHAPSCTHVASFACDAPFFPADLVVRFLAAVEAQGADLACAASEGRTHPVFGLWPIRLKEELRRAMVEEGVRKVDVWTARYRLATVEFLLAANPAGSLDPFFNANRPDDLAEAERFAAG
jgi:molybdenum cofactor guanylyltransferase